MNLIHNVFDRPVIEALGWTLIHFLWQGAAVGLIVLIAKSLIKASSAKLRYAISAMSLLVMLALPLITFAVVYSLSQKKTVTPVTRSASFAPVPTVNSEAVLTPESGTAAQKTTRPEQNPFDWLKSELAPFAPWFVAVWILGVALLSSRFIGGLIVARRLKTNGTDAPPAEWIEKLAELKARVKVSRTVRLYRSIMVEVPTVIGWLRPVILVPASAITGLSSEQLEALLAHELAHIRRYDYLVNILQTAVETLLFYHPVVWWISAQVRAERENCCDDLAVAACGDVLTYARALADLELLRSRPQLAMAADGASLLKRIERLVGKAGGPRRHQIGPSLAVLITIGVFAAVLAGASGAEPGLVHGAIDQARVITLGPLTEAFHHGNSSASPSAATSVGSVQKTSDENSVAPVMNTEAVQNADQEKQDSDQGSTKAGDYIEQLSALGYKNLTVEELITLRNQGVTPEYIKGMRAAGYDHIKISELIALRIQDVTPEYIKQMAGAGFPKLSLEELISMRIQGVTPEYVQGLASEGFSNLSASKIVAMRIQGVTPEYIREMRQAGYDKLSASELIGMRIQGVSPDYVKEMKGLGLDDLSAHSLIAMRIQGVSPDFVKEMRGVGLGKNSVSQLVALKIQDVTAQYVKEMVAAGLKDLSDHEVIALKIQDVSPEFINAMRSAGYANLSGSQLIGLRIQGVTPKFIEELKSAGYSGLSTEDLVALRIQGVDGAYIKKMHDRGFKNLTIRQLIQLKMAGIE